MNRGMANLTKQQAKELAELAAARTSAAAELVNAKHDVSDAKRRVDRCETEVIKAQDAFLAWLAMNTEQE